MAGDVDSQIKAAIAEKDAVIFVLSKDSVESDYVEMELGWAREVEKAEKRQLICPVQLDDTWQERANSSASWGQISRKVVLDFSDWQEGDFPDSEYAKLVQGLLSNYSSRNAD